MIQEILDYLLIKSHFILCTEEELLEKVEDERMLEIYCDNICRILEQEKFFYTSDELIEKLEAIVYKKRFDGKHSKELIVDFNIMIDAINQYKKLSSSDKILLGAKYIDEEVKIRNMPFRRFPGYTLNAIYDCIKNESYYAKILLQKECDLAIYDPLYLLTTVNLLCNRYPEALQENLNGISRCCASVIMLDDLSKNFYYRKMLKKTNKTLEELAKDIPDEDIDNYQKVIKKTEN